MQMERQRDGKITGEEGTHRSIPSCWTYTLATSNCMLLHPIH